MPKINNGLPPPKVNIFEKAPRKVRQDYNKGLPSICRFIFGSLGIAVIVLPAFVLLGAARFAEQIELPPELAVYHGDSQ